MRSSCCVCVPPPQQAGTVEPEEATIPMAMNTHTIE
jgi:hypothetical protein